MIEYFNITTERTRHARDRYALSGDEPRVDVTTNYATTSVPIGLTPNSINQFGPVVDVLYREHNVEILPGGRYRVELSGAFPGPYNPEDPVEYPPTWEDPGSLRLFVGSSDEAITVPFDVYDDSAVDFYEWTWFIEIDTVEHAVWMTYDAVTSEWIVHVVIHSEGNYTWYWTSVGDVLSPTVVHTDEGTAVIWNWITQDIPDSTYATTVRVEIGPEID